MHTFVKIQKHLWLCGSWCRKLFIFPFRFYFFFFVFAVFHTHIHPPKVEKKNFSVQSSEWVDVLARFMFEKSKFSSNMKWMKSKQNKDKRRESRQPRNCKTNEKMKRKKKQRKSKREMEKNTGSGKKIYRVRRGACSLLWFYDEHQPWLSAWKARMQNEFWCL